MGIMGADGAKPHVLFVDRQGNHHYDRAWKQHVVEFVPHLIVFNRSLSPKAKQ